MSAAPVDHSDTSLQIGQVQNSALLVHCPGQVWISVRPAESGDQALPPALLRLVGTSITPADIKALLPDWASLQWEQIPPSDLSSGEWVAFTSGFRVNVFGDPASSIWHHQVIAEMWRFLHQPDQN